MSSQEVNQRRIQTLAEIRRVREIRRNTPEQVEGKSSHTWVSPTETPCPCCGEWTFLYSVNQIGWAERLFAKKDTLIEVFCPLCAGVRKIPLKLSRFVKHTFFPGDLITCDDRSSKIISDTITPPSTPPLNDDDDGFNPNALVINTSIKQM